MMIKTKNWISMIIALTGLTLVTVVYVGTSTTTYDSIDLKRIIIHKNQEQTLNVRSTRICCLILTSPKSFTTRTKAVNKTWARRCDKYYFITETNNINLTQQQKSIASSMPIAPIMNITSGYQHLTQKSNKAFMFAYEKHGNDFDWFVKADDDTYLIVDHLKTFLHSQNSSEPITFGYNFKTYVPRGYHSGGASYVLSREALRRFYEAHHLHSSTSNCSIDGGAEDVEIAACLRTRGVYPGKSLDMHGREMFHPLPFIDHFRGPLPDWLYAFAENPVRLNYNCCSDRTISFHYVSPDEQYLIDFLLYHLKPPIIHESNQSNLPVT